MMKVSYLAILNSKKYFSGFGIIAMIFGFSAMAEAWVTPDSGRNLSEILPHSTPFLNGQPESLDSLTPYAMSRRVVEGCGIPAFANDQYCDDENNNPYCNWDGGACCNNGMGGWDNYCTDCECKGTYFNLVLLYLYFHSDLEMWMRFKIVFIGY